MDDVGRIAGGKQQQHVVAARAQRRLQPLPRGDAASKLPTILRAQEVRARPDLEAEAARGGARTPVVAPIPSPR